MSRNNSSEVTGTLGKSHSHPKALPMTQEHPLHSLHFCIIMYKYEALPSQINNLFTYFTLLSNWGLPWNYTFWFVSLERYIDSLYIFHNLYIELDCLALSQLGTWARSFCTHSNKFFERRRLVDALAMNISDNSQLVLIVSKLWVPPTFVPLRIYSR